MLKPLVLGAEAGRRAVGLVSKVPGADLAAARAVAYAGLERVGLQGSFFRHDIAQEAAR